MLKQSRNVPEKKQNFMPLIWAVALMLYPVLIIFFPFEILYNSSVTKATIVAQDSTITKNRKHYSPIYQYQTNEGKFYTVNLQSYTYPKNFEIGETDDLIYLNSKPERIYHLYGGIWPVFILFLFFTAFWIITFGVFIFPRNSFFKKLENIILNFE